MQALLQLAAVLVRVSSTCHSCTRTIVLVQDLVHHVSSSYASISDGSYCNLVFYFSTSVHLFCVHFWLLFDIVIVHV